MSAIYSKEVVLMEGTADDFVPNSEWAVGMHGFAIMVPPSEGDNRLLDMIWRITMAYASMPRLLYSRTNVRTMVEAVMSREKGTGKPADAKPSGASDVRRREPSGVTTERRPKSGSAKSAAPTRKRTRPTGSR